MKFKHILWIALVSLFISCQDNTDDDMNEENGTTTVATMNDLTLLISDPLDQEHVTPDSNVYFQGVITIDSLMTLPNLTAKWYSDKDGLLHEEPVSQEGITFFTTNELSKNIHKIRLDIMDDAQNVISDDIEIYNALKLLPIEKNNYSNTIEWCTLQDSEFESFELYRATFPTEIFQNPPIYTTNSIDDTSFIDTSTQLGTKYHYKVVMKRTAASPSQFESNMDSIVSGHFIDVDYPITHVLADPARNYAYAIANTSSVFSDNDTGYGIALINTESLEVEQRILQNTRFSDLEIDPSGNYLYAAARSNVVYKINLNSQIFESTLNLALSAHKIEIGTNGVLYYHLTPPTSGSTQFRMYDLNSDSNIPYNTTMAASFQNFSHGDFTIDANNVLYHGESNSSSSKLSKLGTTNNTFSLLDQLDSNQHMGPGIILKDNRIYWNQFVLDMNFNTLGTFQNANGETHVKDISPDGEYALSRNNVFTSIDQTIFKEVPAFYDGGIFRTNERILIYKTESAIFQQYNTRIFLYDFKGW